ncbi:unnamed protein product [Caenorhabditis auriculariae]|uniref:Ribosome biogenesis protein WDR12 homolog n=1 Tax=Caenorhabditis auriculariae TaxID=2777116 RepID=A0A8S1GPH9_9PELO|nr:unnamed protein product [Caenorhabditis auriculariae]
MDDDITTDQSAHVQLSFFTNDKSLDHLPTTIFDVPTSADCEQINSLVNKSISLENESWEDKRFEFLIGDVFLRTTLAEFISEYEFETEVVVKVECVLGLEAPKPLHDYQAPDWVSSVHAANGFVLSTTYSGDIVVWDKKGQQTTFATKDGLLKCSVLVKKPGKSMNGSEIIVGSEDQLLTLYTIKDDKLEKQIVFRGHERSVECVAANSKTQQAISGSYDFSLKLWNTRLDDVSTVYEKEDENDAKLKKRKKSYLTKIPMVTIGGHKDRISAVHWSHNNNSHVVSSSWDHTIIEWDLELAGELSRIRGQKAFTSIDIHPSTGMTISSSTDPLPRLYDLKSRDGSLVKQTFYGHEKGWVESVKWCPNDEKCFVSVATDKSAKMWDIRSGKTALFDIHGHEERILCCSWSEEGIIATGSADCTVKVFDAKR